jgi:hypothetical protein
MATAIDQAFSIHDDIRPDLVDRTDKRTVTEDWDQPYSQPADIEVVNQRLLKCQGISHIEPEKPVGASKNNVNFYVAVGVMITCIGLYYLTKK